MLKAVIFDMDGVLIDSEPIHFQAVIQVLSKYGLSIEFQYYKQFIGSTTYKIWEHIKERFELQEPVEELIRKSDGEKRKILDESGFIRIDGAAELVKEVKSKNYKIALASSSPYEYIIEAMNFLGICELFDVIVSGAAISRPKPAPDIFLQTAKQLQIEAGECLVIEDSNAGVRAAKTAKMTCLGFYNPSSGEQDLSAADHIIDNFSNIDTSFLEKVYLIGKNH